MTAATAPLHPDLADLEFLVGSWSGRGRGEYPTIEPFAYDETITFGHNGKPFLAYTQRTTRVDDGAPMHAETGYWRRPGGTGIEVVMAQPTGVVELYEGTLSGHRLQLATTHVACTATAKDVTGLERVFEVDGDVLRYRLSMAAVGVPMTLHLVAELHRVPGTDAGGGR